MKSKDKSTLSLLINFGTVFVEPPCLTPLVKNVARKWRWWNIPKFSFTQLTEVNNISVWRNPSQFLTIHKGLDRLYQPHLFVFGCAGFWLHSTCQQIWKTQQCLQDWKRSVFIPIPKKGNTKECSNYHTVALISQASNVMLKILQVRLQQYVNHELPDVQAGLRKGRGTTGRTANIHWTIKKGREFQENIYFFFIDYAKAFDCVDQNKLWKILKE